MSVDLNPSRRALLTAAAILCGLVVLAPSAVPAQTAAPPERSAPHRAGAVLVGFAPRISAARRQAVEAAVATLPRSRTLLSEHRLADAGAELRDVGPMVRLRVPAGDELEAVGRLRRLRGVRFAELDYILHADGVPNDPGFGLQWGAQNMGQAVNGTSGIAGADEKAVAAWDTKTGSRSVVIGEVDTGVDYSHPDLAANVWTNPGNIGGCPAGSHGRNVVANTCDPMDDDTVYGGHGTHVAGILGAVGNNGVGVTGVNWRTTILPVKWLDSNSSGSTSQLISALDWLLQAKQAGVNVRVVNDSATFVGTPYSQALSDEIDLLGANDILFVTAAGNTGENNDDLSKRRYPCGYNRPNEICVTASDQNDQLPTWANFGAATVDLAAPGANIYSTLRNGRYGYVSGGSMASPQVAGTAALILAGGDQSAVALKARILDHVDPLPALAGRVRSGGRLDVCAALPDCVGSLPSPSPPPAGPPPAGPPPPAAPPAPYVAPSNAFGFGKVRLNRRKGTATLSVKLPGPGGLKLFADGVRPVGRSAAEAGELKLPVSPKSPKVKRALRTTGSARVRVSVKFSPSAGIARTRARLVTLVERSGYQRHP